MDPNRSNGGNLNGKIMLSAIVVLFAVVIIILFLHLYVRWHVLRRASRRTRRRRRLILAGEIQLPPSSAPNCRLDPSILKSLPVVLFSSTADGADDDDGEELVECAVCLNEFEEGEKIRCLPRCRHGFHIDCIDMWFCSHSTCPLCRAEVEAEAEAIPAADDPPVATGEEVMGSTSSDAGVREVGIQVPAIEAVELLGLVFQSREQQELKLSSCRFFLFWLLLMRRIHGSGAFGSASDLESGFRQPSLPSTASSVDI